MNNKKKIKDEVFVHITKTKSNNCFITHNLNETNGSHVLASPLTASNTKRANLTRLPMTLT